MGLGPKDELWWSDEMYDLWGIPRMHQTREFASRWISSMSRIGSVYVENMRTAFRTRWLERVPHSPQTRGQRWLLSLGRLVLDENNIAVRMLGLCVDITERKLNEEALALSRRLEAVGQLAGGVAHDSNNLLTVIAGSLELAEQRVQDEPTRQLIRRALDASEMGSNFNRRLLSLARRHKLERRILIVNDRVEETLNLLEAHAR